MLGFRVSICVCDYSFLSIQIVRSGSCSGMEGLLHTVARGARELQDEADFASIANGDGEISICGFGSLLSGLVFFC